MYEYGSVTLNNGTRFRARRDEEGRVSFMTHRGPQNASAKIARTFHAGGEAAVTASNRYLFPDEFLNPNAHHVASKHTEWKQH